MSTLEAGGRAGPPSPTAPALHRYQLGRYRDDDDAPAVHRYTIKAKKALLRSGVDKESAEVCILDRESVFISDSPVGAERLRVLASGPKHGFGESYQGYVSAKVCEKAEWSRDFQGTRRGRCADCLDVCPGYRPPGLASSPARAVPSAVGARTARRFTG